MCRGHPDTIHTRVTLNQVSIIDNRGGGLKIYIVDTGEGQTVPCCFDVWISNTVIDGTQVYYYDPDIRTSIRSSVYSRREGRKKPLH